VDMKWLMAILLVISMKVEQLEKYDKFIILK
jgi:hypothetical protein